MRKKLRRLRHARVPLSPLVLVAAMTLGVNVQAQIKGQVTRADRAQLERLSALVDEVAKGRQAQPSDVGLSWASYQVKAAGDLVHVPYAVTLDGELRSSRVAMYVRVVPRGVTPGGYDQSAMTLGTWRNLTERPAQLTSDLRDLRSARPRDPYTFEDIAFFNMPFPTQILGAFSIAPGDYDAYVALQEQEVDGRAAIVTRRLIVPDLSKEFAASSVILAEQVEAAADGRDGDRQPTGAWSIGGLRITPLESPVLSPDRNLTLLFWIYNEALDANGKPHVEVDYSFYRRIGDMDVFFNRTAPKRFTPDTVPAEFDLSAGHQILAEQSVPLASFPEGDYRVTIKIFDNVSNRLILREGTFTVSR